MKYIQSPLGIFDVSKFTLFTVEPEPNGKFRLVGWVNSTECYIILHGIENAEAAETIMDYLGSQLVGGNKIIYLKSEMFNPELKLK